MAFPDQTNDIFFLKFQQNLHWGLFWVFPQQEKFPEKYGSITVEPLWSSNFKQIINV